MKRYTKQIDKLSQWTGERFFKEGKTELSTEFVEYEKDIDLRKRGIERLHATSIPYQDYISKKKPSADPFPPEGSNPKDKIFTGEALGMVMISQGEDMLQTGVGVRQYAERLEKFGRARCKIAMAQEEYATRMGEGYIAGMENAIALVQDYQALRKKLDSRRLALDAATRKMNSSKKENRALEDEVESAQARFEEIQEETLARMATVQESEAALVTELEDFLEAELDFVNQYHTILTDLKSQWGAGGSTSASRPRSKSTSAVAKAPLPRTLSVPKISSPLTRPGLSSRKPSAQNSDEEDKKKSGSKNRERSQSNVSAGGRTKSFIGSFGAFGKKDKGTTSQADRRFPTMKKYGSLNDEDDAPVNSLQRADTYQSDQSDNDGSDMHGELEKFTSYGRDRSYSNTTKMNHQPMRTANGPKTSSSRHHPAHEHRVRALYEYSGKAADELTVRLGDIITVTKEVSPDWWIGENEQGQVGLFPSAYTELYEAALDDGVDFDFDDEEGFHGDSTEQFNVPPPLPSVARPRALPPRVSSAQAVSTLGNLAPPTGGFHDSESENGSYRPKASSSPRPALASSSRLASSNSVSSPNKKPAPPLPPTRRLTQTFPTSNASSSPASDSPFEAPPDGNGVAHRMVMPAGLGMPLPVRKASYQGSPFGGSDDEHENGNENGGTGGPSVADCGTCGCDDFTQNVFKAPGTCSSCFHAH